MEKLPPLHNAPRHQHRDAYVTIVFDGAYEQAAYAGRLAIGAGDLVVQPSFDCHADRMTSAGVQLLRLPFTMELGLGGVFGDCPVDEIRRAARHGIADAIDMVATVISTRTARARRVSHLCDKLAADIAIDQTLRISRWAEKHGRSREALSRQFTTLYGVSPDRYRVELRARGAWAEIVRGALSLSSIAQQTGYADQAHMTRAIRWLTASTPSAWRRGLPADGRRDVGI
jgi:AraC-like DNA-binding protein